MVVGDFFLDANPVFCQINITYLTISVCFILMALCGLAYLLKALTLSGTIAAFITALILAYGGLPFFYLPLVLLIGGTLLSKLNEHESDKTGRNAKQVIANGGVGLLCLLFFYVTHSNILFIAYLVSFTISISDTFSSEIGKYFNGTTVDLIGLEPIEPGLSGGISWQGTLGGLIGALIGANMAYLFLDVNVSVALVIAALGYAGMLLDSLLGSLFQAKYKHTNSNTIEELKTDANELIKGYPWCTNDTVNLLSNAIVVLAFILLY